MHSKGWKQSSRSCTAYSSISRERIIRTRFCLACKTWHWQFKSLAHKNSALAILRLASLHLDYDNSYSVIHHLQAGLLCELVGKRLGIKDDLRLILVKAAITHDISLHDIQDTLDRQATPLSEWQSARIKFHPSDSAAILGQLGVTDRLHGQWDLCTRSNSGSGRYLQRDGAGPAI